MRINIYNNITPIIHRKSSFLCLFVLVFPGSERLRATILAVPKTNKVKLC